MRAGTSRTWMKSARNSNVKRVRFCFERAPCLGWGLKSAQFQCSEESLLPDRTYARREGCRAIVAPAVDGCRPSVHGRVRAPIAPRAEWSGNRYRSARASGGRGPRARGSGFGPRSAGRRQKSKRVSGTSFKAPLELTLDGSRSDTLTLFCIVHEGEIILLLFKLPYFLPDRLFDDIKMQNQTKTNTKSKYSAFFWLQLA